MSSDVAISVRGLTKEYVIAHEQKYTTLGEKMVATLKNPLRRPETETFRALTDVSFDVKEGEVVGIIGRNGAGKSTLLKVLSRITEPTAGEVRLFGRVASLLEVGTGFHPELTGRENIFLNGAILGMTRAEIRKHFDAIVDFAEIERFLDTPVKRYSSGMYVRLAFAVAAHLNPEILIIDEVLSVGDAEFQKKCLGKMQDVSRAEGRTVLFVSHNMAAVESLCGTGCLLEKGALALRGTSAQCVSRYLTARRGSAEAQGSRRVFTRPAGVSPWMKSVALLCEGGEGHTVFMGARMGLEIEFESETALRCPQVGFTILNQHGTVLINANNQFQRSAEFVLPVRTGIVRCDLGAVPLVAGQYSISLYFGDRMVDTHVVVDALSFEVIERDIWGTGKIPSAAESLMWWPVAFSFVTPGGEEQRIINSFTGETENDKGNGPVELHS
jgi:lipopolysaccharide transport system ATP-binding protein